MTVQALYSAATGMTAMETKLDTIANNLANMETTAFKRGRCNFEDLLYRYEVMPGQEDSSGQRTATGISTGLGARVSSIGTDFRQGAFKETGQALNVAITGDGFFKVQDPSGTTLYTRAGNFSKNANGQLAIGSAATGRLLDPPITFPQDATDISISAEGKVTYRQAGSQTASDAGTIELVNFVNPEGLLKKGENLYAETDASGTALTGNPGQQGLGTLQQNWLEASNVEPVSELIDLITTQRAFELNSQVVQAGDQVMQVVANIRRG
jgi:flagellar basal-body rod protein FlgG